MQLKEGSFVNLIGRFDEDVWTDRETGEARSQPVIYLSDIEFAGSRSKGEQKSDSRGGFGDGEGSYGNDPAPSPAPAGQNFQGYGSFGGGSSFFSD
jgi:single-stranded DNA-binding protein